MSNISVNDKFGKLTAISLSDERVYEDGHSDIMWKCKCECGNEIIISENSLLNGSITHCGCTPVNKLIDLSGKRFGKLVVIKRGEDYIYGNGLREIRWLCKCDCGNDVLVSGHSLRTGHTKSCGCLIKESATIHGDHGTPLYQLWSHNNNDMCDEWKNDYLKFKDWVMNTNYADKGDNVLWIDKINPNEVHSPLNTRFITPKEKSNNRKSTDYIEYKGITGSHTYWAEKFGMSLQAFNVRYNNGWSMEKIESTPLNDYIRKFELDGKMYTVAELAELSPYDISQDTMYDRLVKNKWDAKKAISTPVKTFSNLIEYNGDTMSMNKLDKILGFSSGIVSHAIKRGQSIDQIIESRNEKRPVNAIYFVEDNSVYSEHEYEARRNE